jgi:hypothetical protein
MTSAGAGGDESEPDWALSGRILYSACGGTDELLILVSARAVVTLPSTTPLRVHSLVLAELDAPRLSTETVVQSIPLLGEDCIDSFSVVVIDPELRGKPSSITVVVQGAAAVVDVHSGGWQCPGVLVGPHALASGHLRIRRSGGREHPA